MCTVCKVHLLKHIIRSRLFLKGEGCLHIKSTEVRELDTHFLKFIKITAPFSTESLLPYRIWERESQNERVEILANI